VRVDGDTANDCFYYGRIVSDDTVETSRDFAVRLNKLFDTFNGYNEYYCFGKSIQPSVTACLAAPLRMPLAPAGIRKCPMCGTYVSASSKLVEDFHGVCGRRLLVENPIPRIMYMTYVFVDGMNKEALKHSWEEARLWLNSITHSFINASKEGEIPVNAPEAVWR
jgi:hypothetical protein